MQFLLFKGMASWVFPLCGEKRGADNSDAFRKPHVASSQSPLLLRTAFHSPEPVKSLVNMACCGEGSGADLGMETLYV